MQKLSQFFIYPYSYFFGIANFAIYFTNGIISSILESGLRDLLWSTGYSKEERASYKGHLYRSCDLDCALPEPCHCHMIGLLCWSMRDDVEDAPLSQLRLSYSSPQQANLKTYERAYLKSAELPHQYIADGGQLSGPSLGQKSKPAEPCFKNAKFWDHERKKKF